MQLCVWQRQCGFPRPHQATDGRRRFASTQIRALGEVLNAGASLSAAALLARTQATATADDSTPA